MPQQQHTNRSATAFTILGSHVVQNDSRLWSIIWSARLSKSPVAPSAALLGVLISWCLAYARTVLASSSAEEGIRLVSLTLCMRRPVASQSAFRNFVSQGARAAAQRRALLDADAMLQVHAQPVVLGNMPYFREHLVQRLFAVVRQRRGCVVNVLCCHCIDVRVGRRRPRAVALHPRPYSGRLVLRAKALWHAPTAMEERKDDYCSQQQRLGAHHGTAAALPACYTRAACACSVDQS
jgi:hypothetical protein